MRVPNTRVGAQKKGARGRGAATRGRGATRKAAVSQILAMSGAEVAQSPCKWPSRHTPPLPSTSTTLTPCPPSQACYVRNAKALGRLWGVQRALTSSFST